MKKYALMRPTDDESPGWSLMVVDDSPAQAWAPWWHWAKLSRDQLLSVSLRAHLFTLAYHTVLQHPDHFCHTTTHATFHPEDHRRLLDLCAAYNAVYLSLDVTWETL